MHYGPKWVLLISVRAQMAKKFKDHKIGPEKPETKSFLSSNYLIGKTLEKIIFVPEIELQIQNEERSVDEVIVNNMLKAKPN